MQAFRRTVATIAAVSVLGTSLPVVAFAQPTQAAPASLVTTEEAIAPAVQARVQELLARSEVRDALLARGVSPEQVSARVAAMTEEEARAVADKLDQLPAGASDVLGFILVIFIILLVTDILGLTNVFPFTKPMRR